MPAPADHRHDHDRHDHPRRCARLAVELIRSALDLDQLARLRVLLIDAGPHILDALDALRSRPATA